MKDAIFFYRFCGGVDLVNMHTFWSIPKDKNYSYSWVFSPDKEDHFSTHAGGKQRLHNSHPCALCSCYLALWGCMPSPPGIHLHTHCRSALKLIYFMEERFRKRSREKTNIARGLGFTLCPSVIQNYENINSFPYIRRYVWSVITFPCVTFYICEIKVFWTSVSQNLVCRYLFRCWN